MRAIFGAILLVSSLVRPILLLTFSSIALVSKTFTINVEMY